MLKTLLSTSTGYRQQNSLPRSPSFTSSLLPSHWLPPYHGAEACCSQFPPLFQSPRWNWPTPLFMRIPLKQQASRANNASAQRHVNICQVLSPVLTLTACLSLVWLLPPPPGPHHLSWQGSQAGCVDATICAMGIADAAVGLEVGMACSEGRGPQGGSHTYVYNTTFHYTQVWHTLLCGLSSWHEFNAWKKTQTARTQAKKQGILLGTKRQSHKACIFPGICSSPGWGMILKHCMSF